MGIRANQASKQACSQHHPDRWDHSCHPLTWVPVRLGCSCHSQVVPHVISAPLNTGCNIEHHDCMHSGSRTHHHTRAATVPIVCCSLCPTQQAPTPDTRRAAPRSLLRYASTEHGANSTSSSNMGQPIPTATASPSSLPTINNRILQHQAEKFQALQQQMLLEHLLSHQKPHVPCAEPVTEVRAV